MKTATPVKPEAKKRSRRVLMDNIDPWDGSMEEAEKKRTISIYKIFSDYITEYV